MPSAWKRLEEQYSIKDDPLPAQVDMVIGLGTDVSLDGRDASPQSKEIVRQSTALVTTTKAPVLVYTGGFCTVPNFTEARVMGHYFFQTFDYFGPHRPHLILEEKSWRTYQQADACLKIAQEHNCCSVVIIAQQWHARRVRATFLKRWAGSGIQIAVIKANAPYGRRGAQRRFDHFVRFAAWDTAGYIVSKLKGYC